MEANRNDANLLINAPRGHEHPAFITVTVPVPGLPGMNFYREMLRSLTQSVMLQYVFSLVCLSVCDVQVCFYRAMLAQSAVMRQ